MSVAKEAIKELGKTIRKPEESQETMEAGVTKKSPLSKVMIWILMVATFVMGVILVYQRKLLLLKAYLEFLKVWGGLFVPLMILIGIGRSFKNSKWSKTE